MPCERRGNMIICSRHPLLHGNVCHVCKAPSTILCDWNLGPGKTCDKPLCRRHARSGGENVDYCLDHPVV